MLMIFFLVVKPQWQSDVVKRLKGTYYAKLTFSLLLYVYLCIRSASPPLKRKFRQLSQCFVICRVKKWVCKRAVWISPGLWRNRPGDLNIPALAPGISAHTERGSAIVPLSLHLYTTAWPLRCTTPKAKHSCSVVGCTVPHVSRLRSSFWNIFLFWVGLRLEHIRLHRNQRHSNRSLRAGLWNWGVKNLAMLNPSVFSTKACY